MNNFNYDQLDPGIRSLVKKFHEWGFKTSDSGDGVSKDPAQMDGVISFPHIVVNANNAQDIKNTADNLFKLMQINDLWTETMSVEATYLPKENTAFVMWIDYAKGV